MTSTRNAILLRDPLGRHYYHHEADSNLVAMMRWGGRWDVLTVPYPENMAVTEEGWTMIANKTTSDEPAPTPIGDPIWLLDGATLAEQSQSAGILESGTYYQLGSQGLLVSALRAWIPEISADISYSMREVVNGQTNNIPIFPATSGWYQISSPKLLQPGTSYSVGLIARNTATTTVFTWPWNYTASNQDVTPASGQFHERNNREYLQVSKTDADGVDRSADLAGVVAGTVIVSEEGKQWTVDGVTDNGTWIQLDIIRDGGSQTEQRADFTWTVPTPAATKYVTDADFWTTNQPADGAIQGYVTIDGGAGVLSQDAFGAEAAFQQGYISADWEMIAANASRAAGSGASGHTLRYLENGYRPGETRQAGHVVVDGDWTMVALRQTDDKPAPYPVGFPHWVTDLVGGLSFVEQSANTSQLFFGQRYTLTENGYATAVALWLTAGSIGTQIELWSVADPLETPAFSVLLPAFEVEADDVEQWIEFPVGLVPIIAGQTFDIVALQRPVTGATSFTYEWDYKRKNGDPPEGEIWHQSGANQNQMRIHQVDENGQDRSSQLDLIGPGSTIAMAGTSFEWDVLSVSKSGAVYTFIVEPAQRAGEATADVTFTYYAPLPIPHERHDNFYGLTLGVDGLFSEQSYDQIASDNHAYGVDLKIQPMQVSPDYHVLAYSNLGQTGPQPGGATHGRYRGKAANRLRGLQ